ncbi:MAG TPA: hypothetical protein VI076_03310 [Actinopolymorphaceae bacterium]
MLDIVVRPDRTWNGRTARTSMWPYGEGCSIRHFSVFEAEARRVLAQAEAGSGAFDDAWPVWQPDPQWARPELPPEFGPEGHRWTTRPTRRGPLRPGAVA